MLKKIELTNFRRHQNLVVQFTTGLNVIRGMNEQGKTSILEAVNYAFYGANSLREAFEEVVTWGYPSSSLKVVLEWGYNGTTYVTTRSASGAEIRYAGGRITGQTATRQFVEELFQCEWQIAQQLCFANQNSIRGILEAGPTATGQLVEKLAKLDQVDVLIGKVQKQYPYGNTDASRAQIAMIEKTLPQIPEMPATLAVDSLTEKISGLDAKIDLSDRARIADREVAKGVAAIEAKKRSEADLTRFRAKRAEVEAILSKAPLKPRWTEKDYEEALQNNANGLEQNRKFKAYSVQYTSYENKFEGPIDKFLANLRAAIDQHQANADGLKQLEKELAVKRTLRINDKTCALCKKDLTDVPEVVAINSCIDGEIVELESRIQFKEAGLKEWMAHISRLMRARELHSENEARFNLEYWRIKDENVIPYEYEWKDSEPPKQFVLIQTEPIRTVLDTYKREKAKYDILKEEYDSMVAPVVPDTSEAEALVKRYNEQHEESQRLKSERQNVASELDSAKRDFIHRCEIRSLAIQQHENAVQQVQAINTTIGQMELTNGLLARLRAARPSIAGQLWSLVLGSVSHYFSEIRDLPSVVTRTTEGFRVNGKGIGGLSGSTLDALGLAIRLSLGKLFLPTIPWIYLDESFSGADKERELTGLGTLAGCGFEQVILVTHSSLPESLADNVIVI